MRKNQMNEFSVNFERLVLGKFAKGCVCALVSVVKRSSHALYSRKVPSSILGRSMQLVFYLQKTKRAKFRNEKNLYFTNFVNFERLVLGKFAKGCVCALVSVVKRSSHALYSRKVPSSILGRSMQLVFYLQKTKRTCTSPGKFL